MSWLDKGKGADAAANADEAAFRRLSEWESALARNALPSFVTARLEAAAAGKAPWIATMTPVELGLARRHGIRPVAMVSGTCWYHYGYSWTNGHAEGWHAALARMRVEAVAAGANAIVDVRLRTIHLPTGESMDFTVLGTAVRIDGLPPSPAPVVATVPALEFARLLVAGIIPTGIAIGAHYEWLTPTSPLRAVGKGQMFANAPLPELGQFWERVRRQALRELRQDTEKQGDGVLAHTHFGQLLKREGDDNIPTRFLGRHIVIGTVVHNRRAAAALLPEITAVVDMADGASPLKTGRSGGHNAYPVSEEGGEI